MEKTELKQEESEKIKKIEINEQNIKVLLQLVLGILTEEQLEYLSQVLNDLEREQKEISDKSYIG